jgi:hypothetical protein
MGAKPMTKKNDQIKHSLKLVLFSLFFIAVFTSESFAQDINKTDQGDFKFNQALSVGSGNNTAKMNGIKFKSHLVGTSLNMVYNHEKNEIDLSLSSAVINDYLGDGKKLEFQTGSNAGTGMIMFTITF